MSYGHKVLRFKANVMNYIHTSFGVCITVLSGRHPVGLQVHVALKSTGYVEGSLDVVLHTIS